MQKDIGRFWDCEGGRPEMEADFVFVMLVKELAVTREWASIFLNPARTYKI